MPESQPPTPEQLAACVPILHALQGQREPIPWDQPPVAELLRLAAALLHKRKKAQRREARARDDELLAQTGIRTAPTVDTPAAPPGHAAALLAPEVLSRPQTCYICKQPYTQLHAFYDRLCGSCGDFNLSKRRQSADLRERSALVTGARVKIGFQVALKLLRAGARVIATTRFPHDAARRYAALPDAADWAARLTIHGLDLRHLPAVEQFAGALADLQPHLDIFIHNAAQTVRRPPAFYQHLLAGERCAATDLPPLARCLLGAPLTSPALVGGLPALTAELATETTGLVPRSPLDVGLTSSWAELSQLALLPEDDSPDPQDFPPGELDADAQQIDRRARNSWSLPLQEVSTVELLEVQAVNCLAPFVLLRKLEPLLRAGPSRDRYVVLVSAAEGQFDAAQKTGKHPHTNMAKASLNMLTRTCADDLAANRIYLTSVDTGWVSNQAAEPQAQRMREQGFRPPLDAEDGAARVLDPVFTGVNTGVQASGVYLKDYRPQPW